MKKVIFALATVLLAVSCADNNAPRRVKNLKTQTVQIVEINKRYQKGDTLFFTPRLIENEVRIVVLDELPEIPQR